MMNGIEMPTAFLKDDALDIALFSAPENTGCSPESTDTERLDAIQRLSSFYFPTDMAKTIYRRLYFALSGSLRQKTPGRIIANGYANKKLTLCDTLSSLPAESFAFIGESGIGKTSAIKKAISIISNDNEIIESASSIEGATGRFRTSIIPFVLVQCPFDRSVKGLFYEILRTVDSYLGSDYYDTANRRMYTVDNLIGVVSQISSNHIGCLVIDEIQNLASSAGGNRKNPGTRLMACLIQLVNTSAVPVIMTGTPECVEFFEQAFQIARRSAGKRFTNLSFSEFKRVCAGLMFFQYTDERTEFSDELAGTLFEYTAGNISTLVSFVQTLQTNAVLNGDSTAFTSANMKRTFAEDFAHLASFILPDFAVVQPKLPKKTITTGGPAQEKTVSVLLDYVFDPADRGCILARMRECGILEEVVSCGN